VLSAEDGLDDFFSPEGGLEDLFSLELGLGLVAF